MKFRIRSSGNGTYFGGMTGIGPAFGKSFESAVTFDDGMEAYQTLRKFPVYVDADLVNEHGLSCDVRGAPLEEEQPK